MTEDKLKEIENRANWGTPGTFHSDTADYCGLCVYSDSDDYGMVARFESAGGELGEADAERFVHSRQDVLDLIAEVRRLRNQCNEYWQMVYRFTGKA